MLDNFVSDGPAVVDYINPAMGTASSSIASRLLNNHLDIGALRAYLHPKDGLPSYDRRVGTDDKGKPRFKRFLTNDATLRYNDWLEIDRTVIKTAIPRLRLVKDLESRGLVYNLPNGIAKTMLQQETAGRITPATISMDGLRESESDRPVFGTFNFPLPLIHKDFQFSLRQVLASRTGQTPLDTYTAGEASRRVAEQVEQLVLGTSNTLLTGPASYTFNGSSVYGYMNSPARITYSITLPTAGGWTPQTTIDDILAMRDLLRNINHTGDFALYFGRSWDKYLDGDYKATYNDTTLRQRIAAIQGVGNVDTADYLTGYTILMVDMSEDTIRLVKGLDITTIQWESHGGFQLNFKVICLIVPQTRVDAGGNLGIVHGS